MPHFFPGLKIPMERLLKGRSLNCVEKLLRNRVHAATGLLLAQALETDNAVNQSEQGIVAADAAVGAGMNMSAALTVQDVARQNELTVRALRAKALRLAVAAVVGRTGALLMSEELKIHRKHLLASILLAVSESDSDRFFECLSVPS